MPKHPFSDRELDVLRCLCEMKNAKEIALELEISVKTVDRHKANMMNKTGLRTQARLVGYARDNRLFEATLPKSRAKLGSHKNENRLFEIQLLSAQPEIVISPKVSFTFNVSPASSQNFRTTFSEFKGGFK